MNSVLMGRREMFVRRGDFKGHLCLLHCTPYSVSVSQSYLRMGVPLSGDRAYGL